MTDQLLSLSNRMFESTSHSRSKRNCPYTTRPDSWQKTNHYTWRYIDRRSMFILLLMDNNDMFAWLINIDLIPNRLTSVPYGIDPNHVSCILRKAFDVWMKEVPVTFEELVDGSVNFPISFERWECILKNMKNSNFARRFVWMIWMSPWKKKHCFRNFKVLNSEHFIFYFEAFHSIGLGRPHIRIQFKTQYSLMPITTGFFNHVAIFMKPSHKAFFKQVWIPFSSFSKRKTWLSHFF